MFLKRRLPRPSFLVLKNLRAMDCNAIIVLQGRAWEVVLAEKGFLLIHDAPPPVTLSPRRLYIPIPYPSIQYSRLTILICLVCNNILKIIVILLAVNLNGKFHFKKTKNSQQNGLNYELQGHARTADEQLCGNPRRCHYFGHRLCRCPANNIFFNVTDWMWQSKRGPSKWIAMSCGMCDKYSIHITVAHSRNFCSTSLSALF